MPGFLQRAECLQAFKRSRDSTQGGTYANDFPFFKLVLIAGTAVGADDVPGEVVILSDSDQEELPRQDAIPVQIPVPASAAAAAAALPVTPAALQEPIEIQDDEVAQLVDMGFTPEQATKASAQS